MGAVKLEDALAGLGSAGSAPNCLDQGIDGLPFGIAHPGPRGELVIMGMEPGQQLGDIASFRLRIPRSVLREWDVIGWVGKIEWVDFPDAPLRVFQIYGHEPPKVKKRELSQHVARPHDARVPGRGAIPAGCGGSEPRP